MLDSIKELDYRTVILRKADVTTWRLWTDIACGVNAGISTIFVLSGEGTKEDIEEYNIHPDYVFSNIRELCDKLEKEN